MSHKRVIFNESMIRATLAGRKRQLRVPVKLTAEHKRRGMSIESGLYFQGMLLVSAANCRVRVPCPLGDVGDTLWAAETFCYEMAPQTVGSDPRVIYRADRGPDNHWFSASTMSEKESRIRLEILHVKPQRLQDISAAEALLEGMQYRYAGHNQYNNYRDGWSWCDPHPIDVDPELGWRHCLPTARFAYANMWIKSATSKKKGWCHYYDNPWVWVITFKRCSH